MPTSSKKHEKKKHFYKPFVFSNLETRNAKKMFVDVSKEAFREGYFQLRDGQKLPVLPRYWQNISHIDTDNANLVILIDTEAVNVKPIKIIWGNESTSNPDPEDAPEINISIV